ncbi:MAG TPA: MYXO-CTERM sorting domain-containing protein [Kofleriaceae bacterium]|nr:MYXO-CTERM sorting domain-containing protein [Kofleriaceae bacterium]
MIRRLIAPASLAALALVPAQAGAHDVRAYVSQDGLDFISEQVPALVPTDLYPEDVTKNFSCMTAIQRDTHVQLSVDDFGLTIPQEGRISLYLQLYAYADGELWVDDLYACGGETTCQDEFILNDARAWIDFDIALVDGHPRVSMVSVDLDLSEDDINLNFSGCVVGDIAEWMIDFAKKYVIDYMLAKAEEMAETTLGPKIEEMLGGVGAFKGTVGSTDFSAQLEDLLVHSGSVEIGAAIDLSTMFPPGECIAEFDEGEPGDTEGDAPDMSAMKSHIGLALNYGVINDALYHVWRRGLTCLTGDHLAALGIQLPTDHIMELMPGFPPGSTLDIEARFTKPPRIEATAEAEDPAFTMVIEGAEASLIGHLPDGTTKRIDLGMDARATVAAGVAADTNAMVATPVAVEITRMEVDQVFAAETGFDVPRVMDVMNNHMLPKMLAKMGEMPLTGPVFAAGDYAVILRSLGDNNAYLTVNADLFKVPAGDVGKPETSIIEYPYGTVSPANSFIRVSGVDGMIPTELLRYVVYVNGVAKPASYIRRFTVGAVGESGTYKVEVAAMDLSGNTDAIPATIDVTVDGIAPKVLVGGPRVVQSEGGGTLDLAWTMSDDITPEGALAVRIELFEITDHSDALATELIDTITLPAGAKLQQVTVEGDKLYRAEVHVTDGVGNESVSTVLLDATSPAGCGCRAGGGSSGGAIALLLAVLLFVRRRRS